MIGHILRIIFFYYIFRFILRLLVGVFGKIKFHSDSSHIRHKNNFTQKEPTFNKQEISDAKFEDCD